VQVLAAGFFSSFIFPEFFQLVNLQDPCLPFYAGSIYFFGLVYGHIVRKFQSKLKIDTFGLDFRNGEKSDAVLPLPLHTSFLLRVFLPPQ